MFTKWVLSLTLFAALAVMPTCVLRAQWAQANGPSGGNITALTSIEGIIFAGTQNNGVYRTTNNGASWVSVNAGLPDTNVIAIVTLDTDLFVAAWSEYGVGGIFRSTNSGRSWDSTSLNAPFIQTIWTNGRDLFASDYDTLFQSSDKGLTWQAGSPSDGLPEATINSFAAIGSIIFAATAGGVFLSTDTGAVWNVSGMLASTNALLVDGTNLFASTSYDGVFVSTDTGKHWLPANAGLPMDTIVDVFATVGSTLIAGTAGSGIFISSDDGSSWHRSGIPGGSIAAVLSLDSTLYAGDVVNGVFLSTNLGKNWTAINTSLPNSDVFALGINDTNIYAGTGSGPFLSTNSGTSWASDYYMSTFSALLVFSPNTALTDIFYAEGQFIFRSSGNETLGTGIGYTVTSLAAAGFALLAGTDSGGIFFSTDFGNSWTGSGILIDSTNFLSNEPNTSLAVIGGTELFAGIYGQGILVTTDTGTTWSTVNSGLTDLNVNALCAWGNNLFAGTQTGGVFLSTNNGASWQSVNNGLGDLDVLSLAISDSDLLAGTYGMGIWRRPLSDFGISSVAQAPAATSSEIQIYPNPISRSTEITFSSETAGYAEVSIVNMLGVEVARLFSGTLNAGEHSFLWSKPAGLPDGTYECLVRMNGQVQTLPVVLMH